MRVSLAAAFALMVGASQAQPLCFDATGPQKWVAERHGTWEKMSPNQWEFLRGVSAMNPATPPGLAFGAAAALVTFAGLRIKVKECDSPDRYGDSARSPFRPSLSSRCLEQRPADPRSDQVLVLRTG